jgi:hypothetical protein
LAAIECNVIGSHGGNGPKKTVHTTKGRAARTAAAADMTVHKCVHTSSSFFEGPQERWTLFRKESARSQPRSNIHLQKRNEREPVRNAL